MSAAATNQALTIKGNGLITNLPFEVRIEPAPAGHGVVFYLNGDLPVPARYDAIADTQRGVTLAHPSGKALGIVEHLLSAVAMAGLNDLKVSVFGPDGAPMLELPLMDGSALDFYTPLVAHFGKQTVTPDLDLPAAMFYRHNDDVCLYAIPADHFTVSCAINFEHPDLASQWVRWDAKTDAPELVMQARTFGYVRELPVLQSMGMAMGVTRENTVGLTDEGGYSSDLRMEKEPVYHKMLDFIGDLMLGGINPQRLKAHVFAINAGHESHTAFGRKLLRAIGKNTTSA